MASVPTLSAHGAEIPALGFGTSPMTGAFAAEEIVTALKAGYRHIDTARKYGTERVVGEGMRASGVPRGDIFLTTKVSHENLREADFARSVDESLKALDVDHFDLLMIHWPNPDLDLYVETYEGLVELHKAGVLKAIGMSNFKPAHIARLINETGVIPDVNQIQLSPLMTRAEARAFHREHGIVTQSWSPLGGQGVPVLELPVVREIADAVGRTPAQVVLRWNIELGLNTIAKSADLTRLRQNIDIFDFELTPEQVAAISAVDRGESAAVDSDAFGH